MLSLSDAVLRVWDNCMAIMAHAATTKQNDSIMRIFLFMKWILPVVNVFDNLLGLGLVSIFTF